MKPEKKRLILQLLLHTALLAILYFLLAQTGFPIHYIYLAAGAILAIVFFVYNRGFVNKNATPDMLPDTMTLSEKQAFIDLGKKRFEKSKWLLTLIVPILITFILDMLYLFALPMLEEWFG